jgi:hypothetical protein
LQKDADIKGRSLAASEEQKMKTVIHAKDLQ